MAKNLSRFPNLCHAPAQHGEGIRTHMKGVHVDAIALTAKQTGLVKLLDEVAISLDVDLDELCDALRWARKEKAIWSSYPTVSAKLLPFASTTSRIDGPVLNRGTASSGW